MFTVILSYCLNIIVSCMVVRAVRGTVELEAAGYSFSLVSTRWNNKRCSVIRSVMCNFWTILPEMVFF